MLDHWAEDSEYKWGFVTDIESDTVPPGLNEDVIRFISSRKDEPQWLLDWRLEAFAKWKLMDEPEWAHWPDHDWRPIDYQAISYYSAPKRDEDRPQSLDDVDPKLLETYEKLGIPLEERAALAGVAVDGRVRQRVRRDHLPRQARRGWRHLLLLLRSREGTPGTGRRSTWARSSPAPTTSLRHSMPPCLRMARSSTSPRAFGARWS